MPKTALRRKKPSKLELPENWYLSGMSPKKYEAGLDADAKHDGKQCLLLRSKDSADTSGAWTTLMTGTDPFPHQGKRLRLTLWVKTESVGWVAPWFRIDKEKYTLSFDNGCNRQIHGSEDWQQWSIVLDMPEGSTNIVYGVMLGGSGKVWIVEPTIEQVTQDIATDCACMASIAAKNKKSMGKERNLALPAGWQHKLVYRTDAHVDVGVDPEQSYKGQSAACVSLKDAANYESVELYQTMSCEGYTGKRIRFTVQLKSLKVKYGAFLVEIFGPHEGTVALDDMSNRALKGTHNWSKHSFVLDVPENASRDEVWWTRHRGRYHVVLRSIVRRSRHHSSRNRRFLSRLSRHLVEQPNQHRLQ